MNLIGKMAQNFLKNHDEITLITYYYKLPYEITLESLYQINDQSVLFLIWKIKKKIDNKLSINNNYYYLKYNNDI